MPITINGQQVTGTGILSTITGNVHEEGNSFWQDMAATTLRPQMAFNEANARGQDDMASDIGWRRGQVTSYARFGGPQASYNYGAMQGQQYGLERGANDRFYNESYAFASGQGYYQQNYNTGYREQNNPQNYNYYMATHPNAFPDYDRANAFGPRDRFQQNETGRHGASQPRDSYYGNPTYSSRDHGASQGSYNYTSHVNGKIYHFENDKPLTPQQKALIGGAIAFIDVQHVSSTKRDVEVDALRDALASGLSPNAMIRVGNGKEKSLQEFVEDNMMGKRQDAAFAMLSDARANPGKYYTPPAPVMPPVQAQNINGADVTKMIANPDYMLAPVWSGPALISDRPGIDDLNALVNTAPGQLTVNGQQVNASQRMQIITDVLNTVDAQTASQFNAQLAANPNFVANFQNLGNEAAKEGGKAQVQSAAVATASAFGFAQKAENWPQAAQSMSQGLQSNPNAASVMRRFEAQPTTQELKDIHIADKELEEKLRKAVAQQESWDKMAGSNPIAGFFMMLLRPLMQAMNPGSDPMGVLAEAGQRNIEITAGNEAAADKLKDTLGNNINVRVVAGAEGKSGEQDKAQGAATGEPEKQTANAAVPPKPQDKAHAAPEAPKAQGTVVTAPQEQTVSVTIPPAATQAKPAPSQTATAAMLINLNEEGRPTIREAMKQALAKNGVQGLSEGPDFTSKDVAIIDAATPTIKANIEKINADAREISGIDAEARVIKAEARAKGIPVSDGPIFTEQDAQNVARAAQAAATKAPEPLVPMPDYANLMAQAGVERKNYVVQDTSHGNSVDPSAVGGKPPSTTSRSSPRD